MSASYTTLSVERVGDGDVRETVVRVRNFDGDRVLRATPVSEICCKVRVENYPQRGGRRDCLDHVFEFTTSHDIVEQWVKMALSEVAQ